MKKMKFAVLTALGAIALSSCTPDTAPKPPAASQAAAHTVEKVGDFDLGLAKKRLGERGSINAVYDVGIKGFKMVLTQSEGMAHKSLLSDDGRYMLLAESGMLDLEKRALANESLFAVTLPEEMAKTENYMTGKLDMSKVFTVKKGDGSRNILVLSDPDCPFCMRLEQTLDQMDNITIHYLLYPIEGLHPDAVRKTNLIWSQPPEKRAAAWQEFVKTKTLPEENPSGSPYDYAYMNQAGESLGARGTPHIFLMDNGVSLMGYRDAATLEQALSQPKQDKASINAKLKESGFVRLYPKN